MSSHHSKECFNSSKKFSLSEKILMGAGFYASVVTGAYGICAQIIVCVPIVLTFFLSIQTVFFHHSVQWLENYTSFVLDRLVPWIKSVFS